MIQEVEITITCEFDAAISKSHIRELLKVKLKDEEYFVEVGKIREESEIYTP